MREQTVFEMGMSSFKYLIAPHFSSNNILFCFTNINGRADLLRVFINDNQMLFIVIEPDVSLQYLVSLLELSSLCHLVALLLSKELIKFQKIYFHTR